MNIKLLGALASSLIIVGCAGGSQSSGNKVNPGAGYAGSAGSVLMAGGGGCVKTNSYKEDLTIAQCDPNAKSAAEEAAAEEAAALAAEKAAAEQAAADKAAAERAAAEKAAALAAADAAANAPIEMTLNGKTLFASNSSEVSGDGSAAITDLAAQLATFKEILSITVTGHADDRGDEAYNQTLSEQRANTVKEQLIATGIVSASQISTVGKGESDPIASNVNENGRRLNRRVNISIKGMR